MKPLVGDIIATQAQDVPPERIWFYDQLRRDYRGKVKWEGK